MPKNRRLSDAALVRRSQQGDRRAFSALLGRYDRRLRGLAHALLLDQGEMDVALGTGYMRAWRDVVRLGTKDDVAAWLYRATYNACIDQLRRTEGPPPTTPETSVGKGLAALTPAHRVAVVLVDREGFSPSSAARIMGLPQSEFAVTLDQAREQLVPYLPDVPPTEAPAESGAGAAGNGAEAEGEDDDARPPESVREPAAVAAGPGRRTADAGSTRTGDDGRGATAERNGNGAGDGPEPHADAGDERTPDAANGNGRSERTGGPGSNGGGADRSDGTGGAASSGARASGGGPDGDSAEAGGDRDAGAGPVRDDATARGDGDGDDGADRASAAADAGGDGAEPVREDASASGDGRGADDVGDANGTSTVSTDADADADAAPTATATGGVDGGRGSAPSTRPASRPDDPTRPAVPTATSREAPTMSRDTPAHARPAGESGAGPNGTSRPTSPVAQALRDLMPPRHGSTFWTDLDERLADEPQLRLAPRSAIRPITQPPPVIDDRNLAGSLKGDRPPPKRSSRRTILAVAAAVLIVLVGVAALQGPDDDEDTTSTDATTETTAAPATTEGDAPPETEAPPTTAPGTIAADEPLHPGGVGPLTIGARLGDLQAAGAAIQVDAATYEGSGGSCYDAKVAGALDLTLRFRAPDGESRADDPTEGVLTSISIQRELPTTRRTDVGLGVGSPVTDLLGYYGENVDERAHPFLSGGSIYRAAAADGKGTAFFTDGLAVVRVSVGEMDSIRFVNQCG